MNWALYSIFSWIIVAYYITNIKKNELIKNVIIYLTLIIVVTMTQGVISNNLKLIGTAKNTIDFFSVLLNKMIIVPFLMIILNSKCADFISWGKKAAAVIMVLLFLLILEYVDIELKLYQYIRWNLLWSALLNSFYIFITFVINKGFNAIMLRGD